MRRSKTLLTGIIKRHPDGFGFFVPDDSKHPDVYIPKHEMTGVMTNDRVQVLPQKEGRENRYRGEVIEILERSSKRVVGKVKMSKDKSMYLADEGKGWGMDLELVPAESRLHQPNEGEWVAAEILSYPNEGNFKGRVVQVIGSIEDPLTDIQRVALTQHIPMHFSLEAQREAEKFPTQVTEADVKNRKSLKQLAFITIDGATAKDFDDAIYTEMNSDGYKLYVAIADVSHYVKPGTAIDEDAYERGTSSYFPNFVIPMLPEVLSNELCSLKPHVPRLSLVAEMDFDFTGAPKASRFYEAVIESKARVTYGEAQEIIEGNSIQHLKHVEKAIFTAEKLAKVLMARRIREGSLDLELPEVQILVDEAGHPTDVVRSERLFAHRLIEEMMLAANVAVAKFISERNAPCLYRIHEQPKPDAIKILEKFLRQFGAKAKLDGGSLQKKITRALQEFQGKTEALVLNTLALRSMAQAKYSHENVGHFGLGFSHYSHFTSPIRRYPDLIVHRVLKSLIMKSSKYPPISAEEVSTSGVMLSACEQRAVKAERQIQGIKKARYMSEHIGKEFDGVVTSVTRFGAFVTLREVEIDGLVHIDNLAKTPQDRLVFDEERLKLIARRSGFSVSIGDEMRVTITEANLETGQIDFAPVWKTASKASALTRPTPKQDSQRPEHRKAPEKRSNETLDLDAMPIEESAFLQARTGKNKLITRFEPPPENTNFNPSEHLERLLKKRSHSGGPGTSAGPDAFESSENRSRNGGGRSKGPKKSSRRPGILQGKVSHSGGSSSGRPSGKSSDRPSGGRGNGGRASSGRGSNRNNSRSSGRNKGR